MAAHECSAARLVVGDAGQAGGGSPRVGEAVDDAAVEVHLPVHVSGAHLVLEGGAIFGRDEQVVGADADEDPTADVGAVRGSDIGEPGVEPDDGLDVGARSAELQRERPTEAVADDGDPGGIDRGSASTTSSAAVASNRVRSGLANSSPNRTIMSSRLGNGLSSPVVVERESQVPELGDLGCSGALDVVEARTLVRDEHCRVGPRAIRVCQRADEMPPIRFVVNLTYVHAAS